MNCKNIGCDVRLSWFRDHVLHRPGYYLESGWYCSEACLERGVERRLEKWTFAREKTAVTTMQLKIEQALIANGSVTREQIDSALADPAWHSGARLCDHLMALRLIKERDTTLALSRVYNIPIINLSSRTSHPAVLNMIPPEIVKDYGFFPLEFDAGKNGLVLVTHDPADLLMMINVRGILDCQVSIYLGDESVVRQMISSYCERSADLRKGDLVESPGVVRSQRDLAQWIVGRAKTMDARSVRMDCFDRFIWTRFVVDHRPLDFVLTATYAA